MKLRGLPEETRVKLAEEADQEFWEEIEDAGGIKAVAEERGFPASKLYNWKNKDLFLPLEVVLEILGNIEFEVVESIKGKGRGKPVENPSFSFREKDELLTRVQESVNLNRNGIPVYQVDDRGLIERFNRLLQQFGDVPISIYSRSSVYELRYPKFLHSLFERMEFEEDFAALVDESGSIEEGLIVAGEEEVAANEFEGEIFSRQKRYDLAVAKGDEEELAKLVVEERKRLES